MAQNEQLQIGIVVETDTSKAQAPLEKLVQTAEKIGIEGDKSSKRFADSIKRAGLNLSAAGDQAQKFQNQLDFSKTIKDKEALQPLINQFKELQNQSGALNNSLNKSGAVFNQYGLSAKQTAAALRQVPAQLTDIVVSLQGGQAPLTVLLQQGGQLKDIFGGIRPALEALGGALLRLINPFTLIAGTIGILGVAFVKGRDELEQFNRSLILSGGVLGVTGDRLTDIARSISESSLSITRSEAASTLNSIAGSAYIGSENLQRFVKTALEFEKAGGTAAKEVIKNFEELGKSPVDASVKLNETTNFLTFSIYKQIKALEEQGKKTEAAKLAQEEYAKTLEERLPKLVENLGYAEKAWNFLGVSAKSAWDAMLGVGRQKSLEEQAKDLEKLATSLLGGGGEFGGEEGRAYALLEQAAALRERAKAENEAAKAKSDAIKTDRAKIDSDRELTKTIEQETASIKAQIEAAKLRQSLLAERGLDADKILSSEKQLLLFQQQRVAETNKEKQLVLDAKIQLQEQLVLIDKGNDATEKRLKQVEDLNKQYEKLSIQYANPIDKLNLEIAKNEELLEKLREIGKTQDEINKLRNDANRKFFEDYEKSIQKNDELAKASKDLGVVIAKSFEDAIVKGGNFRELLSALEQDIIRIIIRTLVTKPFEAGLTSAIGNLFGGGGSLGGAEGLVTETGFLDTLLSGFTRASGGPVSSGSTYLVGEQGPELFTPTTSGQIIPNNMLASNDSSMNVNINISTPNAESFRSSMGQTAAQVTRMLSRAKRNM